MTVTHILCSFFGYLLVDASAVTDNRPIAASQKGCLGFCPSEGCYCSQSVSILLLFLLLQLPIAVDISAFLSSCFLLFSCCFLVASLLQ